ncbi:MAG: hypothetical protein GY810_17980 [Aureispira sp.]|nr:hypothetical protein [Aureispira sp.]
MHKLIPFLFIIGLISSCNTDTVQTPKKQNTIQKGKPNFVYKTLPRLSRYYGKGIHFEDSSPYTLYSHNKQYYLKSFPYKHIHTSYGVDQCLGITFVYAQANDSLLYTIPRYFRINNTNLSNNGLHISYVNQHIYTKPLECNQVPIIFYNKDSLIKSYEYEDLITFPDSVYQESDWLYLSREDSISNWVSGNTVYWVEDTLYTITHNSKVLKFEVSSGNLFEQLNLSDYLTNLTHIEYPDSIAKIAHYQELDPLPLQLNGQAFQKSLATHLKLSIPSRKESMEKGHDPRYLYHFIHLSMFIHKDGSTSHPIVNARSGFLKNTSIELEKKADIYILNTKFKSPKLPYNLDKWRIEMQFSAKKTNKEIAAKEKQASDLIMCETDTISGVYIPKDLKDCMVQLDQMLDDSSKIKIKEGMPTHFGLGRWLRNNWGLWGGGRLACYFNEKGMDHADDISGVILGAYSMHLHQKPFHIDSLIKNLYQY